MASFSSTFVNEDISDKALWDMFHAAESERDDRGFRGSGSALASVTSHMAVRDALDAALKWAGAPSALPPYKWTGSAWAKVSDFAGCPAGSLYWDGFSDGARQIILGHGWTRKVEKMFSMGSPTDYVLGANVIGTAANGDVARCLDDGGLRVRSGGAWTVPTHPYVGDADLIDLTGTQLSEITGVGAPTPAVITDGAGAVVGELLGHWKLVELRNVLDDLRWREAFGVAVGNTETTTFKDAFGFGTSSNFTTAEADAETDWAGGGSSVGGYGQYAWSMHTYQQNSGAQTEAEFHAAEYTLALNLTGTVAASYACRVQLILSALKSELVSGWTSDNVQSSTFDANGVGVVDGQYAQMDLTTFATRTGYTSPTVAPLTHRPDITSGTPSLPGGSPPNRTVRGFAGQQRGALLRFEDGLTYKTY